MAHIQEQPIVFPSAGLQLRGILGLPAAPEPAQRGIILIHGWAGYRIGPHRMLVHTARQLHKAGIATLRFDLRGRGDSQGRADQTDLDAMIEDTLNAAAFLKTQPHIKHITLLGICSGANVAIGAATLNPDLTELALWSALPFQPEQQPAQRRRRIRHHLAAYFRKAISAHTWRRLLRGDINLRMVGKTITGDRTPRPGERNRKDSARDIMAAFSQFRGRALFITGSKDPEGLAGRNRFISFSKTHNLNTTFHLIEGANHSYYGSSHEQETIAHTIAWLTPTPEVAGT